MNGKSKEEKDTATKVIKDELIAIEVSRLKDEGDNLYICKVGNSNFINLVTIPFDFCDS